MSNIILFNENPTDQGLCEYVSSKGFRNICYIDIKYNESIPYDISRIINNCTVYIYIYVYYSKFFKKFLFNSSRYSFYTCNR